MKSSLLSTLSLFFVLNTKAQSVNDLPQGKYETDTKTARNGWNRGDIIIIDDSHYRLSSSSDIGDYRFSVAAQRIFFISGPLKSAFTKVSFTNGKLVIILPKEENGSLGLTAEVLASKQ